MAANPREELIAYLAKLSDQEVGKLLKFAQILHDKEAAALNPEYDPGEDPLVGFLSGSPDLAERVEDILYPESDTEENYVRPAEYENDDPIVGMFRGSPHGSVSYKKIVEDAIMEKFERRKNQKDEA